MAEKYFLVTRCRGYLSKPDPTNAPFETLVSGSQNVLINDQGVVQVRGGYTLFGAANTDRYPPEGSFEWHTSTGTTIYLRGYDDELEIYTTALAAYTKLSDGFSSAAFVFAAVWDGTEKIDKLIMANGNDYLWDWSGGITTYASATSNTITKEGTNTWAQDRFYTAGTRQIRMLDDGGTWRTFTYTGGEGTKTLTGVTPDPTGYSFTAGANVFQAIRLNDDTPADGFNVTSLAVLNNQLWCGSNTSRLVYMSSNTDFTDYTHSTPRAAGEGEISTLDDIVRLLMPMDKEMWISSGRNDWYSSQFVEVDVGGTLVETLKIKKFRSGADMGCQSQHLAEKIGDYIVFVSFEPQIYILGNIADLEGPAFQSISDPIKTDIDAEDFTNGHIKYHRNRIYISAPANDRVWINELRQRADGSMIRFWQPPQILPVRRFAIIDDEIHGHSGRVAETYKLFDGRDDNGKSFKAVARYAYRNYGRRDVEKWMDEWLTEGYISGNTILTLKLKFDFGGFTQTLEKEIRGDDDDILYESIESGVLGDQPLGDSPLGDEAETASGEPKFRQIHTFPAADFFEIQAEYSTDEQDYYWELLSLGGNVKISGSIPGKIRK